MGLRLLWVVLFALVGCQEKVIQVSSGASSAASYCDSSIASRSSSLGVTSTKTFSPRASVGKIKLDAGTLVAPQTDNSYNQLLPQNFIKNNRGFRTHRVGRNRLVAMIDHACTLEHGIDSQTKMRKHKLKLSESLMTEKDELLQDPRKKLRKSSRSFDVPEDMTMEELAQLAEDDPCIVVVGNDAPRRLLAPTDTHYAANWNQKVRYLDSVNFATAYEKFFGAAATPITQDVVIAVIDSGVLISHDDLDDNLWTNNDAAGGGDNDSNGKIDDTNGWNFGSDIASPNPQTWTGYGGAEGHGTHVAGIIGAEYNGAGVAGVMGSHAKIMGLNVFGSSASASSSDIDDAITYAANEGAQVINMSLGGEVYAATTETAIRNAVTAGVFVVAAAGNGDDNGYGLQLNTSYNIYPGAHAKDINGMMTVGSFDGIDGERSIFSNCSTTYVEIGAPGAYDSSDVFTGGIPSTWHTSDTAYARQNGGYGIMGTSMAAPVVAGAAGLAMSLYKTNNLSFPTPANVEAYLTNSAATSAALSPYFKGGKKLDLNGLYDYVDPL